MRALHYNVPQKKLNKSVRQKMVQGDEIGDEKDGPETLTII